MIRPMTKRHHAAHSLVMPSQGPSSTSAGSGHKRKRSLDDDPVDVGKLYRLKQHMALLREELEGIEETEGELDSVMKQIGNLETILADVKNPCALKTLWPSSC